VPGKNVEALMAKNIHPFNGLFSRTTWVSHLDFNEATDDGVAVASFAPRRRQITIPAPHH